VNRGLQVARASIFLHDPRPRRRDHRISLLHHHVAVTTAFWQSKPYFPHTSFATSTASRSVGPLLFLDSIILLGRGKAALRGYCDLVGAALIFCRLLELALE